MIAIKLEKKKKRAEDAEEKEKPASVKSPWRHLPKKEVKKIAKKEKE